MFDDQPEFQTYSLCPAILRLEVLLGMDTYRCGVKESLDFVAACLVTISVTLTKPLVYPHLPFPHLQINVIC